MKLGKIFYHKARYYIWGSLTKVLFTSQYKIESS